jgi:hypothetical protein
VTGVANKSARGEENANASLDGLDRESIEWHLRRQKIVKEMSPELRGASQKSQGRV